MDQSISVQLTGYILAAIFLNVIALLIGAWIRKLFIKETVQEAVLVVGTPVMAACIALNVISYIFEGAKTGMDGTGVALDTMVSLLVILYIKKIS
ncbi:hypothetical protein [Ralstonia pseudosolanacearum]